MQYLSPELLQPIRAILQDIPRGNAIAVGLSAGADSAMLAVHTASVAQDLGLDLYCIHIHHGLQNIADVWLDQAKSLAEKLDAKFCSRTITVQFDGSGLESAARNARYQAINAIAVEHNINTVLLAHHLNDQAETVLFRLLRGAGPTGLAAMSDQSKRGPIHYLRPWLQQPRALIIHAADAYARATAWQYVKDPTNTDTKYARGVIRTAVAPIFDKYWPAWRKSFARHARQAADLAMLLDEIAAQDLQQLEPDHNNKDFSLAKWRQLSEQRQVLVLRYWLAINHTKMPSQAWLDNCVRQLRSVHQMGTDRNLRLKHSDKYILLRRGRIIITDQD